MERAVSDLRNERELVSSVPAKDTTSSSNTGGLATLRRRQLTWSSCSTSSARRMTAHHRTRRGRSPGRRLVGLNTRGPAYHMIGTHRAGARSGHGWTLVGASQASALGVGCNGGGGAHATGTQGASQGGEVVRTRCGARHHNGSPARVGGAAPARGTCGGGSALRRDAAARGRGLTHVIREVCAALGLQERRPAVAEVQGVPAARRMRRQLSTQW